MKVDTRMTYEQARLLYTLAADQRDLKVANGWYGVAMQGSSTLSQDNAALRALDALGEDIRRSECPAMLRRFFDRLATVPLTKDRLETAKEFLEAAGELEVRGMTFLLGRLEASIEQLENPGTFIDEEHTKALFYKTADILAKSGDGRRRDQPCQDGVGGRTGNVKNRVLTL